MTLPMPAMEPPSWLSAEAKDEWRRVAPSLRRHLDAAADLLAGYCQALAELRYATEMLDRQGRVYEVAGRKRAHPAAKMQSAASRMLLRFADALGLTPASQAMAGTPSRGKR